MADRHRGRRKETVPSNVSRAEREIRKTQRELLELRNATEKKMDEQAKLISDWMEEGVSTTEIGTWLDSPERPGGVSRQYVYKLVAERVDGKLPGRSNNGPRPRPRPKR